MPKRSTKQARRAARALTLQILYEIDVARHTPGSVLNDHLSESEVGEPEERFIREMVVGVGAHREALDGTIQIIAPEWPTEQMAPVDRNILRMALFELTQQRETPQKVVINEAVELARLFGGEGSRRLINGALGAFVSRPPED